MLDEPTQGPSPMPAVVAVVLSAAALVYLAYHNARGLSAFGLDGQALDAATSAAVLAFLVSMGIAGYLARQRARVARDPR